MIWKLGDVHELFGVVVGMRVIEGEPYRFFDLEGGISMIPLSVLNQEL